MKVVILISTLPSNTARTKTTKIIRETLRESALGIPPWIPAKPIGEARALSNVSTFSFYSELNTHFRKERISLSNSASGFPNADSAFQNAAIPYKMPILESSSAVG
jgi:hypothetical protein